MKSLHIIPITALVCACFVPTTASAAVIGMDQWGIDTESLQLSNGAWTEGVDWGYNGNSAWMAEVWVGGPGSQAAIGASVEVDDGRAITPIGIDKSVENTSTFFWTDFHVDLIPAMGGGSISNVTASPSAQFGNVAIIDNMDGSFSINWDNFGGMGTGVAIGETAFLEFGFEIDGTIIFTIQQTPTPEPSTLALLLAGGLLIRRKA